MGTTESSELHLVARLNLRAEESFPGNVSQKAVGTLCVVSKQSHTDKNMAHFVVMNDVNPQESSVKPCGAVRQGAFADCQLEEIFS